jgi:guanine nucleotide-binding protein subunit alpha
MYAPTAFRAEMAAWRAVIDLKLVRSVIFLLNLLEESSPITTTSTADAASGGGGSVNTGPTDDLGRLRVRLSPLRSIEDSLARSILPEQYPRRVGSAGICNPSVVAAPTEGAFDVSARSDSRWKTFSKGSASGSAKARSQDFEEVQKNARRVVEACREDIVALWNHPAVRVSLADQSISLECQSGLCVATNIFFFCSDFLS